MHLVVPRDHDVVEVDVDRDPSRAAFRHGTQSMAKPAAGSVGRPCQCPGMTKRLLRGTELRYLLTDHLHVHGPATVAELAVMLARRGFVTHGRSSKAIPDALRWEIRLGRAGRRRRGQYVPGWMPRSTEHRIHTRVLALREEAQMCIRTPRGGFGIANLVFGGPLTTLYPLQGPMRGSRPP